MRNAHKRAYSIANTNFARWLTIDRGVLWAVTGGGLVLVALLAFLGIFDRPIADDYVWIHQAHVMTIPQYMHQQLWFTYGRYGNALALSLLGKIFYTASVTVAPLTLIILLITSAYYMMTAFRISKLRALAASLGTTAFLLTGVPSIFDTLYWMNSSTLYPLALAGSMFIAGIAIKIWTSGVPATWKLVAALGVALLAGGVNEFAPVINVLIIALICFGWRGNSHPRRMYTLGTLTATQVLAFSVLKWAPGSLHRQALQQSGTNSLLHTGKHSLRIVINFLPTLTLWNIALIIAASAVLALTLYNYNSSRRMRQTWRSATALLVLAVALFIVPVMMTQYAHSLRDNGQPPYRAQTYLVASLILALTTIIWMGCAQLNLRNNTLKNGILLFATIFTITLSVGRTAIVGQSLATRAFLYDQRATIAKLQIKSGRQTLSLPQVPIYATSDTQDLPPSNTSGEEDWVSTAMAEYLGVDQIKTDNSKGLQNCPAINNWYENQQYCDSVYRSINR